MVYQRLALSVIGVLKHRVQIAEIIHGSAVTIQALHSDVILHVPDGVYGIILGNIHTNHWKFANIVHEKDCIIGPICEFDLSRGSKIPNEAMFRIQVTHIARQTSDFGKIRVEVKKMSSLKSSHFQELSFLLMLMLILKLTADM